MRWGIETSFFHLKLTLRVEFFRYGFGREVFVGADTSRDLYCADVNPLFFQRGRKSLYHGAETCLSMENGSRPSSRLCGSGTASSKILTKAFGVAG